MSILKKSNINFKLAILFNLCTTEQALTLEDTKNLSRRGSKICKGQFPTSKDGLFTNTKGDPNTKIDLVERIKSDQ